METSYDLQAEMKKQKAEQIKVSYYKQTGCNYTLKEEAICLVCVFFFLTQTQSCFLMCFSHLCAIWFFLFTLKCVSL